MRARAAEVRAGSAAAVIDMIVLVSIHGLLLLAGYRLMARDDLDEDPVLDGTDDTAAERAGRGAGNAP